MCLANGKKNKNKNLQKSASKQVVSRFHMQEKVGKYAFPTIIPPQVYIDRASHVLIPHSTESSNKSHISLQ